MNKNKIILIMSVVLVFLSLSAVYANDNDTVSLTESQVDSFYLTDDVFEIYVSVNGADSHDKAFRKEGKSWWAQEKITQDDANKALITLTQHNDKVDFVFTHTGGTEVCKMLGFSPTSSDFMLDLVLNTAEYDEHFCGHYHVDKLIDKTRVLYDDVMMIAADYEDA